MKFEITRHAQAEMSRREISATTVDAVLQNPQQIVDGYGNKKAYQSIFAMGTGKDYLFRVIVNDAVTPWKVVTVYKTSKIKKYWREP
jgi:hypothetical protein